MPVVVDYQRLYDLANDSVKTISNIDSAGEGLDQHIAKLHSALIGFGYAIPESFQKWRQDLDEISQGLQQTKQQIVQIAERAGVMVKTAQ